MASPDLTLVLGAGASSEVGLPVGARLKEEIAEALNFKVDFHEIEGGYREIVDVLRRRAHNAAGEPAKLQSYLDAARLVSTNMPLALSIDNFLDSHRQNELVAECGKLAIASCILRAEKRSQIYVDSSNIYNTINFRASKGCYLARLWQLLSEDCTYADLPSRLAKVNVVSFNYDRCLEHYLFHAVKSFYGASDEQAASALAPLKVFHPYGSVGKLRWQSTNGALDYGADPTSDKVNGASKSLRTFTEGIDPGAGEIDEIRGALLGARIVVFLGFAFHQLNIDLLYGEEPKQTFASRQWIIGSALGLSLSNADDCSQELARRSLASADQIVLRRELTAAQLLDEHSRLLAVRRQSRSA